ncbi:MAG: hypothetical protein ACJ8FY_05930 [Gemmataceae bacterium]
MKAGWISVPVIGIVLLFGNPLRAQQRGGQEDEASKNGWFFNLEEGLRQAGESNRPLMVVFRCVP